MADTTASPDRAGPVQGRVVHESERTRVTRLFLPGRTAIRKVPLGSDAQRRLRHELAILERLREVVGVAQMLDEPRYPGSILLVDAGEQNLAQLVKPLAPDDLIGVAERLAAAVAAMHRRGVMHRDICPENIVTSLDGAPCLVGFGLARPLAEIRPTFAHHSQIEGTLAYLAPEQTGRTGRPVDYRADLYALGATLYELATGAPPFGSQDPLGLVHDHLARVPESPSTINTAVPAPLSTLTMHLLEKEPDDRYQSADGVVYDLQQLRAAGASAAAPRVGVRDFPLRLVAQSRLVGRDDELTTLQGAFDDALAGRCSGVLVSGAPGVGKTALVDQLRPVVTGNDGWFVSGKFDQHRRDLESAGIFQAFRALGRLLLAEPDDELAELRERILAALGANAGLAAGLVPEFAVLLGVRPEPGDPLTAQLRVQHSAVATLRAVASRKRPLVVVVDDLQWASPGAVGVMDLAFAESVEGLLLVAAHRDEVDPAHPLAASLSRWRQQPTVTQLHLTNLPGPFLAALVGETLRTDRAGADALAEIIEPHTHGNPYETVELLNTLRQEGMLTPTSSGWGWDEPGVRSLVGRAEVAARPLARLAALPAASREVLQVMACVGGRAETSLLAAAAALSSEVVEQRLAPALEKGVLVAETGAHEGVRFRHDRIREAILAELDSQRGRLQLALARRLATIPEQFTVAAEQYLAVIDAVSDAGERSAVVALLRRAAEQATLVGDYDQVDVLFSAALRVADPSDSTTLVELHTGRLKALFCLGRLEEADQDYRTIEQLSTAVMQRVEATRVQVLSLTHRKLFGEAIQLAVHTLGELGLSGPAADRLPALLEGYLDKLYRWLDHSEPADDLAMPEITDPTLLAMTRLLNAAFAPAHWAGGHIMAAWLGVEAARILLDHGTARGVFFPASYSTAIPILLRNDYAATYRAVRRMVALAEARGYEPDTSQARSILACFSCWFEPVENGVEQATRACEGTIKAGDLASAGYATFHSITVRLDCAPTLDIYVAEADAALSLMQRSGNEQTGQMVEPYRWLSGVLRGEGSATLDEGGSMDRYADNPTAQFCQHQNGAIAAAIFDDPESLNQHTAAAMQLLPFVAGNYVSAIAHLLRGLALAAVARNAPAEIRSGPLSEVEELIRGLRARADDAPVNFLHLLRLLEAERAWAAGDFGAAALDFEAAREAVAARQRPWHRALITERAARFALARGVQNVGFDLLARASQEYEAWGAMAKVVQLNWAYPALSPQADASAASGSEQAGDLPRQPLTLSTGTIDLLAILSASQALSSQTTIEGLHARVVDVLGTMAGASGVRLLLWSDDHQDWLLGEGPGGTRVLSAGTRNRAVPMSVLRYVERTREPLAVADAATDDRFARDPYFAGLDRCSLLALPIASRGRLRAVVLLENRLIRGAFTDERLDAARLIAGQLAVSLDNAQLYAELAASRARIVAAGDQTRRQIERDLHDGAQQRLVSLALELRMAQADVPPDARELTIRLDRALAQASGAMEELRALSRGIHPAILTEHGLGPALRALGRGSPIPVDLDVRVLERLPDQVEVSAYYIVAEALTNAAKHSRASAITVNVERDSDDNTLRLQVADDGVGGADLRRGTGLLGLKDRAETLGGHIDLHSPQGGGTTLDVAVPIAQANVAGAG